MLKRAHGARELWLAHALSYAGPHDRMLECKSGYWLTDVTLVIPVKASWKTTNCPPEILPGTTYIFLRQCLRHRPHPFGFVFIVLCGCVRRGQSNAFCFFITIKKSLAVCHYKLTICCYRPTNLSKYFLLWQNLTPVPILAGHEELSMHCECQGET